MENNQHPTNPKLGTLVKLTLPLSTNTVKATSAISYKTVEVSNGVVGLVVANSVWPDETWPNRDFFQENAPFCKVLFERDILLISENNLRKPVFQILQEGTNVQQDV